MVVVVIVGPVVVRRVMKLTSESHANDVVAINAILKCFGTTVNTKRFAGIQTEKYRALIESASSP